MRTLLIVPAIGLIAALFASPPAASQDASAWADLFDRDLTDWARPAGGRSPWRLTADRTLECDPATDGIGPKADFADGTLRFEYRFRPTDAKTVPRASVTVRRTDGNTGCRIDLGAGCGTIRASFLASSDRVKEVEVPPAGKYDRAVGEWNLAKIRLEGKSVQVSINGRPAVGFDRCDSDRGMVVFETEGAAFELRRVEWKADR